MQDSAQQIPWQLMEANPDEAGRLSREHGLPLWAATLLVLEGLTGPEEVRSFLNPDMAALPLPDGLRGLDEALELLVPAVMNGSTIGVAGDYDADGVTATSLMVEFLRQAGADVIWRIPHRLSEGYGFSSEAARDLARDGAKVIITVDCGISDQQGVETAHSLGVPVVVTDHHQIPPQGLPPARAVINPHQENCPFPNYLAGVGVAFYLAAGLRGALRRAGYFKDRALPNLRNSLDLVALGTCADVVPLKGVNRILVNEGLKVLNRGGRTGLAALARLSGRSAPYGSSDVGFGLAPRINAAGRVGHPSSAVELLLAEDHGLARQSAEALDRLNQERRRIEDDVLGQALHRLERERELSLTSCLTMAGEGWHKGVLGIVASRLVEKTGKPVMLLSIQNGKAVGSGRSVEGFHLQKALAKLESLLLAYGGHALAAAATLPTGNLGDLAQGLDSLAAGSLAGRQGVRPLTLHGKARLADFANGAMNMLERLEPFGAGNPEPLFLFERVSVRESSIVGGSHLKMMLEQQGRMMPAIGFGLAESRPRTGDLIDLAATPYVSSFRGRHLELRVQAIRPAG